MGCVFFDFCFVVEGCLVVFDLVFFVFFDVLFGGIDIFV